VKAALAALILVAAMHAAHAAPTQSHPLEDTAGVIPDADEPLIEGDLGGLRGQTGVDMAVILIDTTGNASIETYARAHAEDYATADTPTALLVLAIKDRKSRLEVSDSLRAKFPDARAQSILDNIRGYLRSGDYTGGIRAVIAEVQAGATGVAPDLESPHPQVDDPTAAPTTTRSTSTPAASYTEPPRKQDYTWLYLVLAVGGCVLVAAWLWAKRRVASRATLSAEIIHSDRPVWLETLWCVMLIFGGVLYIAAIVLMSGSRRNSWSSSSSGWGGSSGGSSFGGGGSGFSGGGASSGW